MNKRAMSVDYGPLTLTVGEDRPATGWTPERRPADDAEAALMRAAVRGCRRRTSGEDDERGRLTSPFALLAEGEEPKQATAGEVGGEIERLWVADPSGGVREVRARIAPHLMARTSLHMSVREGRLQVDLHVGCEKTRRWIAFSLPALGRDLGARLQRDLLVQLFEAGSNDAQPTRLFRWPEDADS